MEGGVVGWGDVKGVVGEGREGLAELRRAGEVHGGGCMYSVLGSLVCSGGRIKIFSITCPTCVCKEC